MSGSLCVKCNMFPGLSLFCFSLLLHAGRGKFDSSISALSSQNFRPFFLTLCLGSKDAVLTDTAGEFMRGAASTIPKHFLTNSFTLLFQLTYVPARNLVSRNLT